jgi:hypothetical protein
MFLLFDRHAQAPMSKARFTGRLYEGEWFEIGRAEHDMFALSEFMAGSTTDAPSTSSASSTSPLLSSGCVECRFSLERFQQKSEPLLRFGNATTQRLGAHVLIQSERERLCARPCALRQASYSGRAASVSG